MIKIALSRPILNKINAFDATVDNEYTFSAMGGDAWLGVLITIKDNTDPRNPDIKIFTLTQSNTGIIMADKLINGHQYQATIQTTTSSTKTGMTVDNTSQPSNSVSFYCYSQPTFRFRNLTQEGIISGSQYAFDIEYKQYEGEYLSSYSVKLYDENNILLQDSGVLEAPQQTISSGVVSCDIVYTIDGFIDGQTRKIQVDGTTIEGTIITTGLITFSVIYSDIPEYTELYAINNCEGGYVTVGSVIDVVAGLPDREPVIFYPSELTGTEADLRNNGVTWVDVFDSDDFSVFLQFRAPILEDPHLILRSESGIVSATILNLSNVSEGSIYNEIVGRTYVYDGETVVQTIDTEYDLSAQPLEDVNYTTDANIYGFMIRRVGGVFTTELTLLQEPIEGLSNRYIYTEEEDEVEVTVSVDGHCVIVSGLTATDPNHDGNVILTKTVAVSITDLSRNGHIVIGNNENNSYLTAVYLANIREDIPIRFKLGSATEPKEIEDLEEGDTYLWAFTDDASISLNENSFKIIDDKLYYYPDTEEG